MSNPTLLTVFVRLLDELVDVWRPVQAERTATDTYRLVDVAESDRGSDESEIPEFPIGSIVRCEERPLSGGVCLVAAHLVR